MARNKAAMKALTDIGYTDVKAGLIVETLIGKGFIEADIKPEELAEKARKWVKTYGGGDAKEVFDKASGWTTESWKIVANDNPYDGLANLEWKFSYPNEIRYIFEALIILAKEAGIEF